MEIVILVFLVSLLFSLIPLVLIIEVYHWVKKRNRVKKPLLLGTFIGFCLGVITLTWMLYDLSGESGFGAIMMAPFVFLALVGLGFMVGLCYKAKGRTILIKKEYDVQPGGKQTS